jgi:hypothetical protein
MLKDTTNKECHGMFEVTMEESKRIYHGDTRQRIKETIRLYQEYQ